MVYHQIFITFDVLLMQFYYISKYFNTLNHTN